VRFAPESGQIEDISPCPLCANSGLMHCTSGNLCWPNLLLRDKLSDWQRTGERGHGYHWQRRIHLRTSRELGKTPARLVIQGNRRRRRRPARKRLCLQSRRASDDRVRLRRQFPALIWRRYVSPCPRRLHGARRHDLAHRRWRPHRAPVHAGRKGAANAGYFWQAGTLHEREAVYSWHHTPNSPAGELYVSDGYGNSRVHKYAPNGKLLLSWGGPGTDPGEFNIAHNISCDADGWVYVADRENHRVQVFDGNGKYETQWNNLHRPCGLFMP